MSKEIIRPEGAELVRYLNEGYAICNKCGAIMDRTEDPAGGCDIYICPGCGWKVDETEYEFDDGEEKEWAPGSYMASDGAIPPPGCRACGGPYPHCLTSCNLFDD